MIDTIAGLQIIENSFLTKAVLIIICRSKKKRIHKKWLKNPKNYKTVPDDQVYMAGNRVFCHPMVARTLRNEIERQTPDKDGIGET